MAQNPKDDMRDYIDEIVDKGAQKKEEKPKPDPKKK